MHQARQVRARIVALAQRLREAHRQLDRVIVDVELEEDVSTSEEEHCFAALDEARAALFAALEELEGLEGLEGEGP